MVELINAQEFKKCVISGANSICKHKKHINDLNIFPVPDGDTGTNMCLTILGVTEKLEKLEENASIKDVADAVSYAALRCSRGNSGVILSIILKGFAKHLKNCSMINANDFVTSLEIGVSDAYSTVSKPTEGTMLTVARVASERGRETLERGANFVEVMEEICRGAREALADTPNLLPVLKKAGVVDAGGKGLCLIFEGMLSYIRDGVIVSKDISSLSSAEDDKFERETKKFDDDIRFTYCTEFIVNRFVNCDFNPDVLKKNLQRIGDCVIVMNDDEIIKSHVHTNRPDKVLGCALSYGKLIEVKIDNLEEQKKQMFAVPEKVEISYGNNTNVIEEPTKKLGTLVIATGDGIIRLFKDLGADEVLEGGQTLNPSAEQIATACLKVPSETVFVFPNNKNIIMAANQASQLVKDRKLVVVPSRFIPQGVAALISFNENCSEEENLLNFSCSMEKVKTGIINYAARDAEFGGFKIKKGDSLVLLDGKLIYVSGNHFDAVRYIISRVPNKDCESIDIYYPSDFTNIPEFLSSGEIKGISEIDINFIFGEQSRGEILIGFNW